MTKYVELQEIYCKMEHFSLCTMAKFVELHEISYNIAAFFSASWQNICVGIVVGMQTCKPMQLP
jgi:hypothetical protein